MPIWQYAIWGAFGTLAVEVIEFHGALRRTAIGHGRRRGSHHEPHLDCLWSSECASGSVWPLQQARPAKPQGLSVQSL